MKVITDSFPPDVAAVKAVRAGADMLLMPQNLDEAYNGILSAVKNGEITETQIEASVRKILTCKRKRGII